MIQQESHYKTSIQQLSGILAERNLTIAFAESASAGKLAYEFSLTEHSGQVLKGSLVCYNACIKEELLGIDRSLIETYTPESPEVTKAMAEKTAHIMKADITVAITGLTSPGGSEHPGKPVGTMFYCILLERLRLERKKIFTGTPAEIIDLTIAQVVKTIIRYLNGDDHEQD